jgi:hypothetical protein
MLSSNLSSVPVLICTCRVLKLRRGSYCNDHNEDEDEDKDKEKDKEKRKG